MCSTGGRSGRPPSSPGGVIVIVNSRGLRASKSVPVSPKWGARSAPRVGVSRIAVAAILVVGLGNIVLPVASAQSSSPLSYEAIDLGVLPGDEASWAVGINALGQIVGSSYPTYAEAAGSHAVLWDEGTVRDLGTLPFPFDSSAEASDINDAGQVAGTSYGVPYVDGRRVVQPSHAFVWQRGRLTDLGTLGGLYSQALAINERGQITGLSETGEFVPGPKGPLPVRHVFVWQNGVMTDLGTPGSDFSHPWDINNRGQVVGFASSADACCAFLWQRDSITPLSGLNPGDQTGVTAINDRGDAVGTDDSASYAPLLWRNGTVTNLSIEGPCPGFSAGPIDINNVGDIVGFGSQLRGDPPMMRGNYGTPEICRDGVHSFLPPLGPMSGNNSPRRMNIRGEVVGSADLLTSDGSTLLAVHAALWRPAHP